MRPDQQKLEYKPGTHVPSLDGLRGLAILLVLLFHFTRTYLPFFRLGWIGVDLFFVLSGFLITGILIDTRERAGYFKNFMVRRALRIFPLFYFTLLVFTLLSVLVRTDYVQTFLGGGYFLSNAGWYWSYLVNWLIAREGHWLDTAVFNHFWSLAIEEQFYFFWPFVVWICSNKALLRVGIGFIILALLLRIFIFIEGVPMIAAYVSTVCRIDALALGAVLAICVRDADYAKILLKIWRPCLLGGSVAFVLMIAVAGSMDNLHPVFATVGYTSNAILFGAVLVLALLRNRLVDGFFNHRIMLFLGKYSYSLYVYHVPVYMLLVTHLPQQNLGVKIAVSFTSAIASIVLSILSWRLLEQPFLNLKRYFV